MDMIDFVTSRLRRRSPRLIRTTEKALRSIPPLEKRFITITKSAVETVQQHPHVAGGAAPVYGMAASLPMRGVVDDMPKQYMDLLYKV